MSGTSPAASTRHGRILPWLLRLGVSAVLLGAVLSQVPVSEIARAVAAFDAVWLAPALVLFAAGVFVRSSKLAILSRAAGSATGAGFALRAELVAQLAYAVVPSVDLARIGLLGRGQLGYARAALVVALDRLSGMAALFALGGAALALRPDVARGVNPIVPALVASLLLVSAAAFATAFSPRLNAAFWRVIPERLRGSQGKLGAGLRALHEALPRVAARPRTLSATLGLALVFQMFVLLVYFSLARGLGLDLSLVGLAAVFPLMVLLSLVPSILGIGPREAAYVLLLSQLGVPAPQAVALSLAQLGLILASAAVGAGLLALGHATRRAADAPDDP